MVTQRLQKYLGKIRSVFDIEELLHQKIDARVVAEYYTQSEIGYRLFHSGAGSIHMALNYDGVFNKDGFYEQARIVQQKIHEHHVEHVLELASGKGFNSLYLAERNRSIRFYGIDLTPLHVALAQKKAKEIANLSFSLGNFQELAFPDGSFDLVFVVESICHASELPTALKEVHRVLKPNGVFIVIDGFRNPGFDALERDLKEAARIVEVSMAVEKPWIVDDFLAAAKTTGFELQELKDASYAVLPTMRRYQLVARGYFKSPTLAKFLLRVWPPYLVKNGIAGLLMPEVVTAKAQGYYIIFLRRNPC